MQPQASPLTHRWQEVARNTQLHPRPPARSPDTGRLRGEGGSGPPRAGRAAVRAGQPSPPDAAFQGPRAGRLLGCRRCGKSGDRGTRPPAECCRGGASGEAGGWPSVPAAEAHGPGEARPQQLPRPSCARTTVGPETVSLPGRAELRGPHTITTSKTTPHRPVGTESALPRGHGLSPPHGSSSAAGSLL